jgi:hypothetical protein
MRRCFPARPSSQARGRRETAAHRHGFGENTAEPGWFVKAGTIPGAYADLAAIEGDPLKGIEAVRRVRWLMRGGEAMANKR